MVDDPGFHFVCKALRLSKVAYDLISAFHESSLVLAGQGRVAAAGLAHLLVLQVAEMLHCQLQNICLLQFVKL
jgi:hypothetical protein